MCSTLIFFKIISLLIRPLVFLFSNLFENFTMLSNFFKVSENIQVLNSLKKFWEGATNKGFKSSWEFAVRYPRWSKNGQIRSPMRLPIVAKVANSKMHNTHGRPVAARFANSSQCTRNIGLDKREQNGSWVGKFCRRERTLFHWPSVQGEQSPMNRCEQEQ